MNKQSIKQITNKHNLAIALLAMVFMATTSVVPAYAAATTETVGASTVSTPSAEELLATQQFTDSIMAFSNPGLTQQVIGTRTPGTNSFNQNLDAPDVTGATDIDLNEIGVLSVQSAYQCEPSTEVTIAVSDWTMTVTGASSGERLGGGGGLINMANPTITDPAPLAVYSGGGFSSIPETQTVSGGTFTTTFADLPNYIFVTGSATRTGDSSTPGDPSDDYQSSYTLTVPTIQLEYDDTGCTLIQSNTGNNDSNGTSSSNINTSSSSADSDSSSSLAGTGLNYTLLYLVAVATIGLSSAVAIRARHIKI